MTRNFFPISPAGVARCHVHVARRDRTIMTRSFFTYDPHLARENTRSFTRTFSRTFSRGLYHKISRDYIPQKSRRFISRNKSKASSTPSSLRMVVGS